LIDLENKILFLDRDGTLIYDRNYLKDSNQVTLIPGAANFLHEVQDLDVTLHVVSNQSGVGRNLITDREFEEVDTKFRDLFLSEGITFKTVKYCIHKPSDNCICRKPKVALFKEELNRSPKADKAAYLGNSEVDELAAKELSINYWSVPSLSSDVDYETFFHKLADKAKSFFNE
jgi:D-glycero-D-manno-heptose 1,7-bisphosphate phosphatase